MQYAMKVFEDPENEEFRVIDRDGDPWFIANEVCARLGIGNAAQATARLDTDEKGIITNDTLGGSQRLRVVNESGLYSLIMTSRKPQAKRFKKWVTSQVLPEIRKTGSFAGSARTPAFIRRFNENWDRVDTGYFSVIGELVIRLHGRLESAGHLMKDRAPDGKEIRPDVSVGKLFAGWLEENYPNASCEFSYYEHKTPEATCLARQYPHAVLPQFIEFVDTVWIPNHAERYLKSRDAAALPYLPNLLPNRNKPKAGMTRRVTRA